MAAANRPVIWAPKANQDLIQIWRYLARVASAEIADTLLHEIDEAAERLAEFPFLGPDRDEVLAGIRSVLARIANPAPLEVYSRLSLSGDV